MNTNWTKKTIHDIVILVLGFALTWFVGHEFQKKEWDRQNGLKLKKEQRDEALKVYSKISDLIDNRLYHTYRLNWDNRDAGAKETYNRMLYEFNRHNNSNLALLEIYFGNEVEEYYRDFITDSLQNIYSTIMVNDYNVTESEEKITSKIKNLNSKISWFNRCLAEAIKNNNIGDFRTVKILKKLKY